MIERALLWHPRHAELARWLEEDGFEVEIALSVEHLTRRLVRNGVTLVVSPTVPPPPVATASYRTSRHGGPAVVLVPEPGSPPPAGPWPVLTVLDAPRLSRAVIRALAIRRLLAAGGKTPLSRAQGALATLGAAGQLTPQELGATLLACAAALDARVHATCGDRSWQRELHEALGETAPSSQAQQALDDAIALRRPIWRTLRDGAARCELLAVPVSDGGKLPTGGLVFERCAPKALGRGALLVPLAAADAWGAQLEREAARRHRQHQGRLTTLGVMAASVAHELNTPLSFVRTNLEMLAARLEKAAGDSELPLMIGDCLEGVQRMVDIVDTLRTTGRRAPSDAEVDLCTVVRRAALFGKGRGARGASTRVDVPPEPVRVKGDVGQLIQVVLNLLNNGLQAAGPGGLVTLRVRREGEHAWVEVEDDGPGVPDAQKEEIFEEFFTTKGPEEGTGLGLSLSRDIARAHQGELTVHDAPFGGALFRLALRTHGRQPSPQPVALAVVPPSIKAGVPLRPRRAPVAVPALSYAVRAPRRS